MTLSSSKTRVLIVDDPAFRRILTKTFSSIPYVEVIGAVASVEECKARLANEAVDLLSLDVVLKEGPSLGLLDWLRTHRPKVLTILMTAGNDKRASQSIDAILLGAAKLIIKPQRPNAPTLLTQALTKIVSDLHSSFAARPKKSVVSLSPAFAAPRDLIAIGSSTGGPAILLKFLQTLPKTIEIPIVITQHLAAEHVDALVKMLDSSSNRHVLLAQHGAPLRNNEVHIAGSDSHLLVMRQANALIANLSHTEPENFCRPAVDPMFCSIAKSCGRSSIGVVMTGMGADGAKGALALRSAGAAVVVQDEASSVVWGMPGATVAIGAANVIASGEELGLRVASLIAPTHSCRAPESHP